MGLGFIPLPQSTRAFDLKCIGSGRCDTLVHGFIKSHDVINSINGIKEAYSNALTVWSCCRQEFIIEAFSVANPVSSSVKDQHRNQHDIYHLRINQLPILRFGNTPAIVLQNSRAFKGDTFQEMCTIVHTRK